MKLAQGCLLQTGNNISTSVQYIMSSQVADQKMYCLTPNTYPSPALHPATSDEKIDTWPVWRDVP